MSKRQVKLYVEDINSAIEDIKSFTKDLTFQKFKRNKLVIDAVVRNLEVIGEAARNIPKETKDQYPEISWRKIESMRNRIIHEYFNVDLEIVWDTIQKDLPTLEDQIKSIKE